MSESPGCAVDPARESAAVSRLKLAPARQERQNGCAMLMVKEQTMLMPPVITQQGTIEADVRAVQATLRPDVIRIWYEIGEDWSGQWAIFFRTSLLQGFPR